MDQSERHILTLDGIEKMERALGLAAQKIGQLEAQCAEWQVVVAILLHEAGGEMTFTKDLLKNVEGASLVITENEAAEERTIRLRYAPKIIVPGEMPV